LDCCWAATKEMVKGEAATTWASSSACRWRYLWLARSFCCPSLWCQPWLSSSAERPGAEERLPLTPVPSTMTIVLSRALERGCQIQRVWWCALTLASSFIRVDMIYVAVLLLTLKTLHGDLLFVDKHEVCIRMSRPSMAPSHMATRDARRQRSRLAARPAHPSHNGLTGSLDPLYEPWSVSHLI
jgi:hypothetical protein